MHDALYYADWIAVNYKPRAILIYEGVNDTGMSDPFSIEMILDYLNQLVEKVHTTMPENRIYLLALKPNILREQTWPVALELNRAYREVAESDTRLLCIDTATPRLQEEGMVMRYIFVGDNLHLNEKGYEIWSKAIQDALNPVELEFE